MNEDLPILLKDSDNNVEEIIDFFRSTILPKAIDNLNEGFSPRRLCKLSRAIEPLPTEQRQLSSYRTRLGTMLEYGLSTEIEKVLLELYGNDLYFSFAVAHEFPDFYLRNEKREPILKIEMKAVDADSDEQAARFDVLTESLNENRDFILFIGWTWDPQEGEELDWEYPKIFTWTFIPAIEIAKERDRRLYKLGGIIEDGVVLVPSSKKKGTYTKDPGNFGKLWRIVQNDRRHHSELDPHMKKFVEFLTKIDDLSPRNRIKKI